jgi:hypothetical protein
MGVERPSSRATSGYSGNSRPPNGPWVTRGHEDVDGVFAILDPLVGIIRGLGLRDTGDEVRGDVGRGGGPLVDRGVPDVDRAPTSSPCGSPPILAYGPP